jgi:hypothetical protein
MFEFTMRRHAIEEDTLVRLPRTGGSVEDDPLLEVLRSGARRMLQQAALVHGSRNAHGWRFEVGITRCGR